MDVQNVYHSLDIKKTKSFCLRKAIDPPKQGF